MRELEAVIEKGLESFLRTAAALEEIRTARLYRQTYPTYQAYLLAKWAISLSRGNQMILSIKVARNLVDAGVMAQEQAAASPETLFRLLRRVKPELQTLIWELVKRIEREPDAALVNKVVSRVRDAIAQGWAEHHKTGDRATLSGSKRNSGQLQSFVRLAARLGTCDPMAIACGFDEACLGRHLRAARQMLEFSARLVVALEGRLAPSNLKASPCIAALPAS